MILYVTNVRNAAFSISRYLHSFYLLAEKTRISLQTFYFTFYFQIIQIDVQEITILQLMGEKNLRKRKSEWENRWRAIRSDLVRGKRGEPRCARRRMESQIRDEVLAGQKMSWHAYRAVPPQPPTTAAVQKV